MTTIAFLGAGSVVFTRDLLADLLAFGDIPDLTIHLHDIDADRLATAEGIARSTADHQGATPVIASYLDRREALAGADFVINSIQVGGFPATEVDFEVPARFGLRQTIGDTVGIGGIFRALRTFPVLSAIAQDVLEICPDAWFLNYTNPMAILIRAVAARSSIPTVGLCHSVYWTIHTLAGYLGVPPSEVDHVTAGVNHLAWVLRLERDGVDLYPALRAFIEAGGAPDDDLVRAELFRRFGLYPTESSEHHAEYNPWFIPKDDLVSRYHIPIGEYLSRVAANLDEYAATKRALDAGEPFDIERSGEYAAVIAHARATGTSARIVGNVMNDGGLIPNIAADACVEVPCEVDGRGVRPIAPGPLPTACAAYVHPAVDTQALTVQAALEEDRDAIYHAVLCDPQVQARLTLDQAWHMTDELIAAEARWLPAWLGGTA